jgi:hypothetical protein
MEEMSRSGKFASNAARRENLNRGSPSAILPRFLPTPAFARILPAFVVA